MLDKCFNLHQKISNKLKAALHRLPSCGSPVTDQSMTRGCLTEDRFLGVEHATSMTELIAFFKLTEGY